MSKINKQKIINTLFYGLILLGILIFGTMAFMPKEANAATYRAYNEPTAYNSNVTTYDVPAENPRPGIISISPSSANAGSGGKTVTITGSNFIPNSVARWNGSNRPTTFIDYSHLLVQLSPSDMVGSGGRYITVFNPGPGGGYSNSAFFTIKGYVAPNPQTSVRTVNYSDTNSNSTVNTTNNNTYDNNYTENGAMEDPVMDESNLASNAIFGSSDNFGPSGLIQWIFFAILILIIVILVRKFFGADKEYFATPLKHD